MEVSNVNTLSNNQNTSNNAYVSATQWMNNIDSQTTLPTNSTARKRLMADSPAISTETVTTSSVSNAKRKRQSSKEREMFCLLVSNLPYEWTHEQITEFIGEHCTEIYGIKILENRDPDSGQSVRLSFLNTFEKCNETRKQLKLKMVNGRKLNVVFDEPSDSYSESSSTETLLLEMCETKPPITPSPWQQEVDIYAPDSDGLYGLKMEFLESLGITPPLDKWVHVSNFRCDKSELKEVLELAGHVVICTVITISKKYAQVMYSHPLEAVQAVSMLNGQLFYGQVLKVSMYRCPNNEKILPKGLTSVGPGLGKYGKPLRDVAREYERHMNGRNTTVDDSIFNIRSNGTNKTPEKCRFKKENSKSPRKPGHFKSKNDVRSQNSNESLKIETVVSPKKQIDFNATQARQNHTNNVISGQNSAPNHIDNVWTTPSNVPITNTYQGIPQTSVRFNPPVQNIQTNPVNRPPFAGGLNYPTFGRLPNPGQIPPNTWANNAGPMNSVIQTPVMAGTNAPIGVSSTVEVSNLPLTTTFPLLSEKMAQIGQVLSLELTRAGCALVRFASPAQAENCYKHYNNMCVMGNTIAVRFV